MPKIRLTIIKINIFYISLMYVSCKQIENISLIVVVRVRKYKSILKKKNPTLFLYLIICN